MLARAEAARDPKKSRQSGQNQTFYHGFSRPERPYERILGVGRLREISSPTEVVPVIDAKYNTIKTARRSRNFGRFPRRNHERLGRTEISRKFFQGSAGKARRFGLMTSASSENWQNSIANTIKISSFISMTERSKALKTRGASMFCCAEKVIRLLMSKAKPDIIGQSGATDWRTPLLL